MASFEPNFGPRRHYNGEIAVRMRKASPLSKAF